jgi:hypothetical protein
MPSKRESRRKRERRIKMARNQREPKKLKLKALMVKILKMIKTELHIVQTSNDALISFIRPSERSSSQQTLSIIWKMI